MVVRQRICVVRPQYVRTSYEAYPSAAGRPFSCLAVAFITAFFGGTQMQFCRCNQLECPKIPALLRFPDDMFNIPYAKF